MTWKQLAEKIQNLTKEQQNTNVTFFDGIDEYYPCQSLNTNANEVTDVLDKDHPFLIPPLNK